MKNSLLISTFTFLAATICPSYSGAETITPTSVSDSGCLSRTKAEREDMYDFFQPEWEFEYSDSKLTLKWHNFIANCCTDGFGSNIERDGNSLLFSAWEIFGEFLCDCECPFDITSTFEGIEPGHYKIEFMHYGRIIHSAEIDVFEGAQGNLIMPAGICELASDNGMLSISKDGILKADVDGNVTIEIYDSAGQICAKFNTTGNAEISLNSLAHGVYIAKAKHGDRTDTLRFIR